jgi:amino acid adenylation domain-containing protein
MINDIQLDLITTLSRHNIKIQYANGKLKLLTNEVVPDDLLEQVRNNKEELIQILNKDEQSNTFFPIAPTSAEYVLSSSQRRLWVLSQFEDANKAYNMPFAYVLEGKLNIEALFKAFTTLIERHESLRTIFKESDISGDVYQVIKHVDEVNFELSVLDVRENRSSKRTREQVQSFLTSPFDLSNGPLLRASILHTDDEKWILAIVIHHIISDGWSMDVFFKELSTLYNTYLYGGNNLLPPLPIQYKDFAYWQQQRLKSGHLEKHKDYWLNQLAGNIPILDLLTDQPRPAIKSFNGSITSLTVPIPITFSFKELCQDRGTTLFMGLAAIVNILLHRYTQQNDIIIGSPIAGREHEDLNGQIGFFVNTVPLRNHVSGDEGFASLLKRVQETTLGAYEHQAFPFDELIDSLKLKKDPSRNPLFDVMVVLQNAGTNTSNYLSNFMSGIKARPEESMESFSSKFDLTFSFFETNDGLKISINYNTDLFLKSTAERIASHILQLIYSVTYAPERSINSLNYLTDKEKEQILTFSGSTSGLETTPTVVKLFEDQVRKQPDAIALVNGNKTLTYLELNQKSNKLANFLLSKFTITKNELVAVKMDRSAMSIISFLAVLKAGGAYVPIDMDYPSQRINYMLSDCDCHIIIDDNLIEEYLLEEDKLSVCNPDKPIKNKDLVYVMYTSGSTGEPKGVMVEHAGIISLVKNTNYINIQENDCLLSISNFVFDGSTFDIFGAFLNGAKLVIPAKEELLDLTKLNDLIERNKVSMFFSPTAFFNAMVTSEEVNFGKLKAIIIGGESASVNHIEIFIRKYPQVELVNGYGPTENTTFSTFFSIDDLSRYNTTIPIGKSISNSFVYILDKQQNFVPIGVMGEIFVAGPGLARGYLNKPELTDERFVPNPFSEGKRMYRTGDLGRWLPDGNIEFRGRNDHQVKVRGYRIELGEIETILQKFDGVLEVVVICIENTQKEKEIVAYFTSSEGTDFNNIIQQLRLQLPTYMVPSYFVPLEKMPLTPNGKVDKKQLPAPMQMYGMQKQIVEPRTETEAAFLSIWKEVLEKDHFGVTDNFFDLGGHSLKAIRLQTMLNKKLGLAIKLNDIYARPTIEDLIRIEDYPQRSNLLLLQKSSSIINTSVYFIPPVLGNSILYKPLAEQLGKNFNCYGLQYSGMEDGEKFSGSIEEMALEFVNEILKFQGDEHFALVGYSMGSTIAFEMAKLLEGKNKSFELFLLDRNISTNSYQTQTYSLKENNIESIAAEYAKRIPNAISNQVRLRKFLANNLRILNNYTQEGMIKSNIHVFESAGNKIKTNMKLWQLYTEGSFNHHYLEQDHWNALSPFNIAILKLAIRDVFPYHETL